MVEERRRKARAERFGSDHEGLRDSRDRERRPSDERRHGSRERDRNYDRERDRRGGRGERDRERPVEPPVRDRGRYDEHERDRYRDKGRTIKDERERHSGSRDRRDSPVAKLRPLSKDGKIDLRDLRYASAPLDLDRLVAKDSPNARERRAGEERNFSPERRKRKERDELGEEEERKRRRVEYALQVNECS